jgi:hypothetical protein
MAGPRVGPKARPRTGSGLPTTSFLRPALQDVDGAPSHTMTCERQCAASADSFVSLRTPKASTSREAMGAASNRRTDPRGQDGPEWRLDHAGQQDTARQSLSGRGSRNAGG